MFASVVCRFVSFGVLILCTLFGCGCCIVVCGVVFIAVSILFCCGCLIVALRLAFNVSVVILCLFGVWLVVCVNSVVIGL